MSDKILLSQILFENFDFEEFKQIAKGSQYPDTPEKQKDYVWSGRSHPEIDYAKKHLQYLDAGSARTVFALDANSVLKIARNDLGLEQNQMEVDIWKSLKNGSKALTAIYDYDQENYKWVIHERVKMLSDIDFESLTGIHPRIFNFVVESFLENGDDSEIQKYLEFPKNLTTAEMLKKFLTNSNAIKFVKDVVKIIKIFGLNPGDIIDKHFGLAKDGHIKLYDYGYLE